MHFRGSEKSQISKFPGPPSPRRLTPSAFASPPPQSKNAAAVRAIGLPLVTPGHRMAHPWSSNHVTFFTISRLHARQAVHSTALFVFIVMFVIERL